MRHGSWIVMAAMIAWGTVASAQSKTPKKDDKLTLTVVTKTNPTNKFSKADKLSVFILINGDNTHKLRLLNPKKNNFELGATDSFKNLPIDLPIDEIESVRVAVEGDDLWKCDSISFQFSQNGMQSKLYKFSPTRYLSGAKEKKAFNPVTHLDFKLLPKPALAPPDSESK